MITGIGSIRMHFLYFLHSRARDKVLQVVVVVEGRRSHSLTGFVSTDTDVPESWVTVISCTSRLPPCTPSASIRMRVSTKGPNHHSTSVSTQRVTVVSPQGPEIESNLAFLCNNKALNVTLGSMLSSRVTPTQPYVELNERALVDQWTSEFLQRHTVIVIE